jgi:membrane associated rhomboid family serine protease/predicted negative regulator of RcsB-dependent stress response
MFVHIGVIHIALNMYCLMSLGPLAETMFGSTRFLGLYVLSGVAGAIASAGMHPQIVSAGASGAIFGVAGALAAVIYVSRNPVVATARGHLSKAGIGTFVAYNLFYGFANSGIDNAAHIGGLVAGFLMGLTLPVGSQVEPERPLRTGLVFLGAVVALAGGFVGVKRLRHTDANVEIARQQLLRKDYPAAIERLQGALRANPHNAQARTLLAAIYIEQDKPNDAIRELELADRDDSANAFVLVTLGGAHWSLKQWDKAAAAYARATLVDPSDASAWANQGAAWLNAGQAANAVAPLQRAIRLEPAVPGHRYNLGLVYLELEQFEDAVRSFRAALELSPDNALALLRRGYCYQKLGQRDSARADYERVLNAPEGAADAQTVKEARRLLSELQGR